MKTKTILKIPKEKINGERIGQIIYNAIVKHREIMYGILTFEDDQLADFLYSCENNELQEIIDEYLANNKEKSERR